MASNQAAARRPLSGDGGTRRPGNRSLTLASGLSVKTAPFCLKMASTLASWRSPLMGTAGVPMRIGPPQLAATFGSELTLRTTEATGSAAHNSVLTTSRNCGAKPDGSTQAVQVPALERSQSAPVLVVTYALGVAPEKPP